MRHLTAGLLSVCISAGGLAAQEQTAAPRLVPQLWHEASSGALSSDGDHLLTAGFSGSVLWHVPTGTQILHLPVSGGLGITFGPEGRTALAGGILWDLGDGSEIRRFGGGGLPLRSAVLSPDGRYVLTATLSEPQGPYDMSPPRGSMTLRDAETGREIRSFPGWAWAVFSPDGNRVLGGHPDGGAAVWDRRTGEEVARLASDDRMTSGAISPDRRRVATVAGGEAEIRDLTSGSPLRRLGTSVASVTFSPDGRYLLTGHDDGMGARLWDVETGVLLRHFLEPPELEEPLAWFDEQYVGAVDFSPDGRRIVAVGGSRKLPDSDTAVESARLWDVTSGAMIRQFRGRTTPGGAVAASEDGRWVVAGGAVWDLGSGMALRRFGTVAAAAFSPEGRLFLAADGRIYRWDLSAEGEARRLGQPIRDRIHSIAVSPEGDRIAVVAGSSVQLRDADDGSETRELSNGMDDDARVAFSPDGRLLAAGDGGSVRLWDLETGEERRLWAEGASEVTSVAFAPDGYRLLGAGVLDTGESPDRRSFVYLWDPETGELVERMRQGGAIHSALFSEGGHRVLTATRRAIRVWDPHWGAILREVPYEGDDLGSIATWGEGEVLFAGSEPWADDGAAYLLDVERGARVLTLLSFTGGAWAAVSPDGRYDASNDGRVEHLHWVVGTEVFPLERFRDEYYTPGLLEEVMDDEGR